MSDGGNNRSEMNRLEQALAAWLEFREAGSQTPEEFLTEHGDLRDLLEPLLDENAESTEDPFADQHSLLQPGAVLDDFRILKQLGQGGMGVVFEAHQQSLDRRVAIKALRPHISGTTRSIVRFKREALTAARLNHRQIVDVYSVGEVDGVSWFAMEFIDGPALDDYASQLRSSAPDDYRGRILAIFVELCRALHFAHEAGVVHRDIKPSNILVRPDDTPVITDFGLSRQTDLPSITRSTDLTGTPYYMSPEQVRNGSAGVDRRCDIFSVGVMLYELLTSSRPFDGDSSQAVIYELLNTDPEPPNRRASDIPRDLAAVIEHSLEKDPDQRYATADALATDIERFLGGQPVSARHLGARARTWRWLRREPIRMVAAAAIACTVLAIFAFALHLSWTGPATQAGQRVLTNDRVGVLLLEAVLAPYTLGHDRDLDAKRPWIDRAFELGAHEPHIAFSVANYYLRKGAKQDPEGAARRALALLDRTPPRVREHEALLRLRARAQRALGNDALADSLEQSAGRPDTALGHYAESAFFMYESGHHSTDYTRDQRQRSKYHAQRSVALSDTPRAEYFLQLKQAAQGAGDLEAELIAVDGLTQHFPDSAAAWAHRALTYANVDGDIALAAARRSLELSPDNYFGLYISGQVAAQRGMGDAAERWFTKCRKLYPRTAKMFMLR